MNTMNSEYRSKQKKVLAAVASDQFTDGSCLAPHDMARLIDNGPEVLAEDQVSHLYSCDSCLKEWISLSNELQKKSSPSTIVNLFSHRNFLKATGSALAIAASILIFINIPKDQLDTESRSTNYYELRLEEETTSTDLAPQATSVDTSDETTLGNPISNKPKAIAKQSESIKQSAEPMAKSVVTKKKKKQTDRQQAQESQVTVLEMAAAPAPVFVELSQLLDSYCSSSNPPKELLGLITNAANKELEAISGSDYKKEQYITTIIELINKSKTNEVQKNICALQERSTP